MPLDDLYSQAANLPSQIGNTFRQNQLLGLQRDQVGIQQQQEQRAQQEFQARQEHGAQYNALLQQYLGPQEGQMAADGMGPNGQPGQAPPQNRNAILGQMFAADPQRTAQIMQFQQAQQQQQAEQERAHAEEAVRSAQFVLASKSPRELLLTRFPGLVKELRDDHGVDLSELDDEGVKQLAQQTIAEFGPKAGIGPDKTKEGESPFAKINPGEYTRESVAKFQQTQNYSDLTKAAPAAADTEEKAFSHANVLRDEYTSQAAPFATIKSAYENIKTSKRGDAGDTALVLNFMKLISPQSRINPGEAIEDAASVPGLSKSTIGLWNKLVGGGKLNDSQRAEIRSQANDVFSTQETINKALRKKYTTLAKISKVDPALVVLDTDEEGAAPAAATATGAPKVGAVEDGYRFNGGNPADPKSWSKL